MAFKGHRVKWQRNVVSLMSSRSTSINVYLLGQKYSHVHIHKFIKYAEIITNHRTFVLVFH